MIERQEYFGRVRELFWHDLEPHWHLALEYEASLFAMKKDYASSLYMNSRPNFIGALGEITFGLATKLAPNLEVHPQGDKGHDFFGDTDVKATPYNFEKIISGNAYLIENMTKNNPPAKRYVLVVIDEAAKRGAIFGWCFYEELISGPTKDFGYGDRYVIDARKTWPWFNG